jgi:predicted nucleic acid-binding protein
LILVDTSVWIDHLHKSHPHLVAALEREDVSIHPFIIGELACGSIANRDEVLHLLPALPTITIATYDEVLLVIERHRLMGRGIGYVDAHLITSVMLTENARLWTGDKRLRDIATSLAIAI